MESKEEKNSWTKCSSTPSTLQLFQKLKLWKGILGQGSTEQNLENGFKAPPNEPQTPLKQSLWPSNVNCLEREVSGHQESYLQGGWGTRVIIFAVTQNAYNMYDCSLEGEGEKLTLTRFES